MVAAAFGLLVGCTGPGTQVRERASFDFDCPEETVQVEWSSAGWVAHGCGKEAVYLVRMNLVERSSEIRRVAEDGSTPGSDGGSDAGSNRVK